MQINALLELLNSIKEIIEKNKLIQKYQSLSKLLVDKNTEVKNAELSLQLTNIIRDISETYLELEPLLWYDPLRNFFDEVFFNNILALRVDRWLNSILTTDVEKLKTHAASVAQETDSIKKSLENIKHYIKEFEQIKNPEDFNCNLQDGEKMIRIFFKDNVAIKNLDELEKYSRIWNGILQVFANLTKEEDSPFRIAFVDKLYLILIVGNNTAKSLLTAVLDILETNRRLLELKNLKNEIRKANLSNEDKFYELLNEETNHIIDNNCDELSEKLIELFNPDCTINHPIYKSLKISTQQLLNFIQKGGKFNAVQKDINDELNITGRKIINEYRRIATFFN